MVWDNSGVSVLGLDEAPFNFFGKNVYSETSGDYGKDNSLLGFERKRYFAEKIFLEDSLKELREDGYSSRKDYLDARNSLEIAVSEAEINCRVAMDGIVALNLRLLGYGLRKYRDKFEQVEIHEQASIANYTLYNCAGSWDPLGSASFGNYFMSSLWKNLSRQSEIELKHMKSRVDFSEYLHSYPDSKDFSERDMSLLGGDLERVKRLIRDFMGDLTELQGRAISRRFGFTGRGNSDGRNYENSDVRSHIAKEIRSASKVVGRKKTDWRIVLAGKILELVPESS